MNIARNWWRRYFVPLLAAILVFAAAPDAGAQTGGVARPVYIVVVGDSLGEGIWGSLFRHYFRNRQVRVVSAARASTGFNATPYHERLAEILAQHPVDLIIVHTGTNDRQRVLALDGSEYAHFGTPRWHELYSQRLTLFLGIVQQRKIPTLWVGMPIMKNPAFDEGMRRITSMHREHAERHGAKFLDIHEFTAGPDGEYVVYLTDEDGRVRRFRHDDGFHFWEWGYERVALHVLAAVRKQFPDLLPAPQTATSHKP